MSAERDLYIAAEAVGLEQAIALLNARRAASGETLTIIANAGLHKIPDEFVQGELFIATDGNTKFTDAESVQVCVQDVAKRLAAKLRERQWQKIVLVPFGHSVVSMTIKLVVFRVTRLVTHDLFYFSDGHYELIPPIVREDML